MAKRKNIPNIDIRSEEIRTLDILLESRGKQSSQDVLDWIISKINSIKERYQSQIEIDVNPDLNSLYSIEARPRIIPIEGYQRASNINPMESFQRKMPLGNDGAYRILPAGYSNSEDY